MWEQMNNLVLKAVPKKKNYCLVRLTRAFRSFSSS
ncbi:unnamed protein product [Brassica oleracea]